MTSDPGLVRAVRAGTSAGVLAVDDPEAVAAALAAEPGTAVVAPHDLAAAVAAARVRVAEVVVDRARHARPVAPRPLPPAARDEEVVDEAGADRQAVRFALVILVLALPAGVAVYLADGLLLAPALPAVALLGLGAVVLAHRRVPAQAPAEVAPTPSQAPDAAPPDLAGSPAVHAADAHLRRALAAWKLHWWERDRPVPDRAAWSLPEAIPLTLVALDPDGQVDEAAVATMTATAPAAVRVVVLQAR